MDDSSPQNPTHAPHARRVLLIDADDGGRDMTRGLLKLALQGNVEIAETGDIDEAVGMFASGAAFDCVLLDCDLPGVDVPDALRRIGGACGGEEAELPCPVVVLNGSDGAARAEAVFGAGAQDRIAKQWLSPPFLRRVLENAIERFAMQRRARGQAAELAEAAERLRASERQRTLALEAADMGTFEAALPGGELTWDRRCRELFGLEDRADVTMAEGIANIHPEDRPRVERAIAAALDPAVAAAYDVEYRVAPPGRPVAWVRAVGRVTFRDDPDAPAGRTAERFVGVLTNVTARVQAERQRALALESAQMGTWELDPAADTVAWDERCRAMFGMSDRPITSIGEALLGVHAEDRDRVRAAIDDAMDPATGGEYDVDYRVAPPGGPQRWVRATGRCTFRDDAECGPVADRFYGVITDVTDRVEAERQRRVALDSAEMGTWEIDLAAGVIRWDGRCGELIGLDGESMPVADAFAKVCADDRERVRAAIERAIDPDDVAEYDIEYRVTPGGVARWVRAVGRAVFHAGDDGRRTPERLHGVVMDVTRRRRADDALRRSEDRLRLAQKAARIGTFEWDIRTNVNTWSPELEALYGLPPGGFGGSYEAWAERVHPDDLPAAEACAEEALTTGGFEAEWRAVWPDGSVRWLAARGHVFRDDAGRPLRMVGANVDITERKRAEEALAQSEARLRLLFTSIDEGYCLCEMLLDDAGRPHDYRFLEANPLFERFTGIPDPVGRTAYTAIPGLEPHWRETYARAALGGETLRFEQWAGSLGKWFDVYAAPVGGERRFAIVFRDVTERKLAEARLRENEARLRQALDAGGMGSFVWYPDPDRSESDARTLALFGLQGDSQLTLAGAMATLVHPGDRDRYAAAVAAALDPAGDGALREEVRIVRPDGEERRLLIQGAAAFDGEPRRVMRMAGLATDVTKRRLAEERLREREAFNAALMEGSTDCVKVLDLDGRILHMNGPGVALMEFDSLDDVRGREYASYYFEDQRQEVRDCVARAAEGGTAGTTAMCPTARGTRKWWDVTVSPVRDEAGRVLRLLCVSRDVTDRRAQEEAVRRSERELRSLTANIPDIVARFDRDLRHLFVNEAVTKATGHRPEQLIGKTNLELDMPPDIVERWRATLANTFETGHEQTHETAYPSPGGERRYETRMIPEPDADGRVRTVLTLGRDVTHARRMERQMRASMEEAERANAAKDHFLAVLSHELRTPLTPVLAAAGELARRDDLPADVREDLAMIRRNVELEARLMDDLLDLTRVARGKLELEFRPTDAHDKIRRVVEMVAAEAEGKQVTLSLDLDAARHTVPADAARLQQVFWNLLKNAVKFTPPGGRVSLSTRNLDGRLIVEVSDTGAGIDADLLPRIFDAFEQGGGATTRQFGGLGLGLAITKVLVDLHGGAIAAASPGRDEGATFTLDLPTAAPVEPARDRGEVGPSAAGRLRVLLIEDDVDTAKIMARLLKARGMTVKRADSVATGRRALDAESFDVILSDLGLPDGSGHDLLRQARAAGVATPAVVLSGFGSERDREQSAAVGFAEHLTKPIDFDALVEAVRRIAAGPAMTSTGSDAHAHRTPSR